MANTNARGGPTGSGLAGDNGDPHDEGGPHDEDRLYDGSGRHCAGQHVSRRRILSQALALSASAVAAPALPTAVHAQAAGAGPATRALRARGAAKSGTSLVLLGTHGGPGIDPNRAQTASAVVVDGRPYLIDCGYGAVRQLVASRVGYLGIGTIFFTHLHDDHTGDLPALLTYQWTNGKTTPTEVYGPYGTARLIDAAVSFLRTNAEIRTVDEGRTIEVSRQFHGHDFPAPDTPVRVFEDDRVSVTAIQNAHYPPRSTARMPYRSVALRMRTPTRSIVFCGDTAYSPNVVALARGADVFLCEVASAEVLGEMRKRAKAAAAAGHPNNIYRHVADTHSSPDDVGRMASEAQVKTVVLNHQVPGPSGTLAYPVTAFIDGVRRKFGGEVIVGEDLMVL